MNVHGNDVTTEIYAQFEDNDPELVGTALKFSKENNIVESEDWLNLIEENGLDGKPKNTKSSLEERKRMSEGAKGKKLPEETKLKMSKSHKGKKKSPEHLEKIRQAMIGNKLSSETKKKISEKLKGKFSKNKNPSAKIFIIYDERREIVRVCCGDFHNFCKENNLPTKKLRETLKGGVVKYKQIKEKDKHFLKYEGWFIKEHGDTLKSAIEIEDGAKGLS